MTAITCCRSVGVAGFLPRQLRRPCAYCLMHVRSSLSVEELARAMNVNRKTLLKRFKRSGWPPPSSLIVWTKLLVAASLLEGGRYSVENAAREAGLQSSTAFRL